MMVTAPQTRLMTAEELLELPDDGKRHELIRGELCTMSPASAKHGGFTHDLSLFIGLHVRENALGRVFAAETGFILTRDPDTVLAPDIAFVRADRLPSPEQWEGYLAVPPDLVVEVLSPSDRASEVHNKVMFYLEAGVLAVWVLDGPRRTITVWGPDRTAHILTIDDTLDGGDILPGFQLPLTKLFT
jgi:Uma2 family endonuclease